VPKYDVKFFNTVSGWLHTHLKGITAENEQAARVSAVKAFNDVHAFEQAFTDPNTGQFHASKGTPGYDASAFTVNVAPVADTPADAVHAQHAVNNPTVTVGGVEQPSVPVQAPPPEPMFVRNPNYVANPGYKAELGEFPGA
jgi:hypothetical protein